MVGISPGTAGPPADRDGPTVPDGPTGTPVPAVSPAGRPAAGGGIVVAVGGDRLTGWVTRFGGRNGGIVELAADDRAVTLRGGNGTVATMTVPFPPMAIGAREPIEALLDHLAGLGLLGLILVRAGAHSIGLARDGVVLESSTHRPYVQGRTAAGGWSQQRYARRRGNQLTFSLQHAAGLVARVVLPVARQLNGLVLAGDASALTTVLDDPRLTPLAGLPRRTFGDIPEPRREVLDAVAVRALNVDITVRAQRS